MRMLLIITSLLYSFSCYAEYEPAEVEMVRTVLIMRDGKMQTVAPSHNKNQMMFHEHVSEVTNEINIDYYKLYKAQREEFRKLEIIARDYAKRYDEERKKNIELEKTVRKLGTRSYLIKNIY